MSRRATRLPLLGVPTMLLLAVIHSSSVGLHAAWRLPSRPFAKLYHDLRLPTIDEQQKRQFCRARARPALLKLIRALVPDTITSLRLLYFVCMSAS